MKIERRHVWIAAAIGGAAVLTTLMLRPESIEVETAVVDRGPLRVTVDEDGETRVRDRFVVASPVTGRLQRLSCEVGDSVGAGDVLARIYPLPLDTRTRAEAAGRLLSAEAARRAADARVAQADAVWGEARRSMERLERVEAGVRGAVALARLDEARTAERSAALALEQARSAAAGAAHDVETARAALVGADGALQGQPTLVRAPSGGRVLRLYEECERVITAGSPIVEIGDPAQLEVVVDVLTDDAAQLSPGAAARVSAGAGDTIVGRIRRIEPSAFTRVSPLGVEEQRVNVLVAFDDASVHLGDRFRVDASLVVWQSDDVLRVPVSALFRVDEGWGVFVVDSGRAGLRRIGLGQRGRRHAEVLSGLAAGERVVLYPSEDVADGVRVRAGSSP